MNLRIRIRNILGRRVVGVARFPFGQPGDALPTMLPPHLESVAVRSIIGSVDRSGQLDRKFRPLTGTGHRLQSIIRAMQAGRTFPPIEIYRLHGICYVVDGHHRVAAALETGQLYLDALVTECILPTEGTEHALEEARVQFALRTGLRSLTFCEPARYQQALAQIHEHRWYMGERGRIVSLQEAAGDWYDTIYLPVVRDLIAEQLTPRQAAQAAGDSYLQLCDLKYGVSHERGHDIGFTQAIREWAATQRRRSSAAFAGRLLTLRTMA
ncbi:MAG TPA: DUF4032 domain-containing protein [Chloroflexota bacterium]|nr:DUF4032 domain-containing protein [Chloroflexota bacterium]